MGSRTEGDFLKQKTAAISTTAMSENRGMHRWQRVFPFSICCSREIHEDFVAPYSHPEKKGPDIHQKVQHSATKLILLQWYSWRLYHCQCPHHVVTDMKNPQTQESWAEACFGPHSQQGWWVRLGSAEVQAASDPLKSDHPQTSHVYWTKKKEEYRLQVLALWHKKDVENWNEFSHQDAPRFSPYSPHPPSTHRYIHTNSVFNNPLAHIKNLIVLGYLGISREV